MGENQCICETGWKSKACDECVPYWNCPNQGKDACNLPNECLCHNGSSHFSPDDERNRYCGHKLLTKTIDPKKTKENKEKKTTLEDHSHIVKILSSKDLSHIGKNN